MRQRARGPETIAPRSPDIKDSGREFRELLGNLPAAAYLCDAAGLITYFNERAQQLWGRAPSLNDPADRWCGSFRLYHRDGSPIRHEHCWMAQALKSGREFNGKEILIERPDGHRVAALAHANPLRDADGNIVGAVNVLIDVSERLDAEERLRLVFGSIEDHLVTYDRLWRYTFITDQGAAILGRRKEELLGRCLWDVFPEAVGSRYCQELRQAMAEQRVIRSEHYDAALDRWFENHIHPSAQGVAVYCADITWRKKAERALRESEQRHRALTQLMPAGVYVCDAPSGILRYYNRQAAELWGREPVLGDPTECYCGALRLYRPDGTRMPHERSLMADVLAGGPPVRNQEAVIERPDGSRVMVMASIDPIHDAAGNVVGAVNVFLDVTEQRRAEQSLREREELLRLAQRAAAAGVWSLDPASGELRWSAECHDLYGTDAQAFMPALDSRLDRVHADDRERLLQALRAAVEEGREIDCEFRVEHPRRGTRWLWELGKAEPGSDGRPARLSGLTIDITDRRAAHETQVQLAAIVNSSEDAIIGKTLEGVVTSWNPGAERLFGRRAADMVGRSILTLIPPERHAEERMILEQLRTGGRIEHYETQRLSRDGRIIDISLSVAPIRDAGGTIVGVSSVARDITARKRAEARLKTMLRLSERLNSTLDADALLDILLHEALQLVGADSGFSGLYTAEGMVASRYLRRGESVPLALCAPPGHSLPGWLITHKRPYLTNDAQNDTHVLPQLRRDFGVRCALSMPILTAQGEPLGFFELHNKPGGFDGADSELALALARSAAIAMQNALIHRSVLARDEALRLADRRKDDFLAVLAHELRNPLAPISNSLHILRTPGLAPQAAQQVIEIMERQTHHLVRLVDDLLEVSRITRGMIELKKQRVELAEVLRDAIETSRPLIESARHTLQLDLPEAPLVLVADPVRLAQVFANLLNNATRYTPPGGQLRLSARSQGREVIVSVRDNGSGIPRDRLDSIFEMFSRGGRSLAEQHSGLGVGLTLARGLAEMHGGAIQAHSEGPGRGSEFTVRLPLAGAAELRALTTPARPAAPAAAPRRRKVLAVDDNRDAADSLGLLLRSMGAEARVVYDGGAALEALRCETPDLVLLDISMPGMDGYEVARQLRQMPGLQALRLVALTGNGREQDRRRSREAGFDHHLLKPVDAQALRELLARLDEDVPGRDAAPPQRVAGQQSTDAVSIP